jgi:hypothetical protein
MTEESTLGSAIRFRTSGRSCLPLRSRRHRSVGPGWCKRQNIFILDYASAFLSHNFTMTWPGKPRLL